MATFLYHSKWSPVVLNPHARDMFPALNGEWWQKLSVLNPSLQIADFVVNYGISNTIVLEIP